MFKGIYTPLITPFLENGAVDWAALDKLVDFQLENGADGFVLLGTTAETPTLSLAEKKEIVSKVTKKLNGSKPVIIGAGLNDTAATVALCKEFLEFKPDAFLMVTPYYNKPNISGLTEHYRQIAALKVPIVLYHIPGRTGLRLTPAQKETLIKEIPLIKAVKESDSDFANVTETAVRLKDKIDFMCGNDDVFPQFLAMGSSGIISAAANVLVKSFVSMYKDRYNPLCFDTFAEAFDMICACYYETNPTCVKYMLSKMGLCGETVRLPLGPVSAENKKKIDLVMQEFEIKTRKGCGCHG